MGSVFMKNRKGRKQARKISRILRKLIRALDGCDQLNGFQ
jgi:hypothetical protein